MWPDSRGNLQPDRGRQRCGARGKVRSGARAAVGIVAGAVADGAETVQENRPGGRVELRPAKPLVAQVGVALLVAGAGVPRGEPGRADVGGERTGRPLDAGDLRV